MRKRPHQDEYVCSIDWRCFCHGFKETGIEENYTDDFILKCKSVKACKRETKKVCDMYYKERHVGCTEESFSVKIMRRDEKGWWFKKPLETYALAYDQAKMSDGEVEDREPKGVDSDEEPEDGWGDEPHTPHSPMYTPLTPDI